MDPNDPAPTTSGSASTALAEERTDLAAYRTAMAANRSLMAWVRTGIAINGFGYTVYKFLHGLTDQVEPGTARHLGLVLTGLGTAAIVVGTIEHWQATRALEGEFQIRVPKLPRVIAGRV